MFKKKEDNKSFIENTSSKNISPALKKPSSKHWPVPEWEKANEFGVSGLKKNTH